MKSLATIRARCAADSFYSEVGTTDFAYDLRYGEAEAWETVYDSVPAWLSGEWAGESLAELGLGHASEDVLDTYEACATHEYIDRVDKLARAAVEGATR